MRSTRWLRLAGPSLRNYNVEQRTWPEVPHILHVDNGVRITLVHT